MINKCICKKEISEWLFNYSEDVSKETFEKDNILGEKLRLMLLLIRSNKKSKIKFETLLFNIENKEDLKKWFLKQIKKYTHRNCYAWQCRFKIIKKNKKCKIHKRMKGVKWV